MNKKVLEVTGLTKTFYGKDKKPFHAVDHISFSQEQGECLAIIGESGSGKSTTVNMITRLIDATEGTILLDGEDITNLKGKKCRDIYTKMQMVFQSPKESFDARRTLGDGIGESLRNHGFSKADTKAEVLRLLDLCGIDRTFADRYPDQVSGGQCQRAAIARALAIKPKLLICDEATSALDVTVQKDILDLLNDLRKKQEDLSILFICHDLAVVQQFCDRVLVMHDGVIVEEGTPDEVIKNPKDDYTKHLIDCVL